MLIVVAVVVLVLTGPLRAARASRPAPDRPAGAEAADLEAARDAKYREIREAEMDYRTGKLSEDDWRAIDHDLRAEAIEILRRLDRVRDRAAAPRG